MDKPLSIAFVTGQLVVGGAEKQLYLLARGLKQAGKRVSVFTFHPDQGDFWEKPVQDLGIPLYQVPQKKFRLERLALVRNILGHEKPQMVHSWTFHTNLYAALAGRWAGVPVRLGSERANQAGSLKNLGKFWYFWSVRGLDALVANSEPAATALRQYDPGLNVQVVPNGVEIPQVDLAAERNRIRGEWNIPADTYVIGSVGSLVPRKNFEMLIDAASILARDNLNFKLLIIGGGYWRRELEQRAHAALPASRFLFTGSIPNAAQCYPAFDLLCSAALDEEGMPNVLMEASAAGLPVIATRVGGVPQIVDEGETGFIVPVNDAQAMRDRIAQLLADESLRRRMGQAGREKMRREYGVDVMVNRMTQVYMELLQAKNVCAA